MKSLSEIRDAISLFKESGKSPTKIKLDHGYFPLMVLNNEHPAGSNGKFMGLEIIWKKGKLEVL